MTELFVTSGPRNGTRISLQESETYTIGDGADASLRIPGIEQNHLVVKALKGGGFGIKSLQGPFSLNGVPTEVARLNEGDEIEIGGTSIRYGNSKPERIEVVAEKPAAPKPSQRAAAKPKDAKPKAEAKKSQKMIGGFRLLGGLGKGGMGTVYRAEQVSLHREVALKVLSKELTDDPVFVAGFVAEARAAARLHHPNVVQVFDVDHDGDTYFYSMELMHAGSVETRLHAEGKIPVDDAISIIIDAAKGLSFAESMQIVHRDIKPDNLMVDQHGHIKIADLGLAQHNDAETGKILGTPHFMSPEQVQNKKLDHRSDLYALGCTFYRILTGRTPFQKDSKKAILIAQVKETPLPPNKVDPGIPLEVSDIVERMMEKDVADRYQSADELIADLDELFVPESRKGLVIGAIAVAAIVAISAVVWAMTRPKEIEVIHEPGKTILDPAAAKLRKTVAESEARNALLQVKIKPLQGLALADALDAMALKHPKTKAAKEATDLANETRRIEKQKADAAARNRRALDAAATKLRSDFDSAVKANDFRAAAVVLTVPGVTQRLRQAPKLVNLLATLRTELLAAALARLDELKTPIAEAAKTRDADAIRKAIPPLEKILDPETGWPKEALDDTQRGILAKYLEHAQINARSYDSDRLQEIETTAWTELQGELQKADGLFDKLYKFEFAAAEELAIALATRFEGRAAKTPLELLAPAFRKADQFYQAYLTAIPTGAVTIPVNEGKPMVVLGLTLDGDAAGLQVKHVVRQRTKKLTIPVAEMHARLAELFVLPEALQDDLARDTFLAVVGLAITQHEALAYLGGLSPKNDNSGMADASFRDYGTSISAQLPALDNATGQHDWVMALHAELTAARLVVSGLRAMSRGRNRAASGIIEQAVRDYGDQLTIRALR